MGDEYRLAEQFGEVARQLAEAEDFGATLQRIVELAVEMIDGCDHAGVSVVTHRRIETPVQTDEVPALIDRAQHETDEGPCLDAIREHEVFQTGDLVNESRWPRFARLATERTDVRSVLSIRLFLQAEETLGALNLYSTRLDAFDDDDRSIAAVFAVHAAVALRAARCEEQMAEAIAGRDLIGQAKGILMSRRHVDADTAFKMLVRASQQTNTKLREIARTVVDRNTTG